MKKATVVSGQKCSLLAKLLSTQSVYLKKINKNEQQFFKNLAYHHRRLSKVFNSLRYKRYSV